MPAFIDLVGKHFGNVLVIKRLSGKGEKYIKWECLCSCGHNRIFVASELKRLNIYGDICTCNRRKEHHGEGGRKKRYSPEYKVWEIIKRRCYYKKDECYHRYGGRGIEVCLEWNKSYLAFLRDMGRRPSAKHTIERVDNNKGYYPDNCKWATQAEQQRNKSTNRFITHNEIRLCITDWARRIGIKPASLFNRLSRGWSIECALETKPMRRGRRCRTPLCHT